MSEYEILALLSDIRSDQITVIAQIISLHLAIIVGVFYFLHRSGLRMKLAAFVLYSLGYALHLGLLWETSVQIVASRNDLLALTEDGRRLSGMGWAAFQEANQSFMNWVSIVANIAFVALWFVTFYFMFFWKRPKEI